LYRSNHIHGVIGWCIGFDNMVKKEYTMKQGFYIVQLSNNDIKVETISFCDNNKIFENIIKAEYICESIAEFITDQESNNPATLTDKLMKSINLSKFTVDERLHIKDLIKSFLNEYMQ
jgi:hypothetical protein